MFFPAGTYPLPRERCSLDRLARAGADLFEIGLPADDAFLDGPVIQAAYRRGLRGANDLDRALRTVEHAAGLRPTVVMTYWESIRSHGAERMARLLADAGAAGVMVVDLPAHQTSRWHQAARQAGLVAPRLVSRATPDIDLPATVAGASGWLYAPASTASTGYQGALDIPALADFTKRLRAASPLPVVSGVGISTPTLAAHVAPLVNAVVIGTPVIRAMAANPSRAPDLAAAFAHALRPTAPAETHD